MIAYLNGLISHKSPTHIYIDCHGVGYHVNISLHTYEKLQSLDNAKVYTYLHMTDNAMILYGFADENEKEVFTHLLSVSGIGLNTARVILSYLSADEVKTVIIQENVKMLNSIKGIGTKTAQRIILDLKEKMMKIANDLKVDAPLNNKLEEEAVFALMTLGFPKPKIESTLKNITKNNPHITSVEELIKLTLKNIT